MSQLHLVLFNVEKWDGAEGGGRGENETSSANLGKGVQPMVGERT